MNDLDLNLKYSNVYKNQNKNMYLINQIFQMKK